MKAAVLYGNRDIRYEDYNEPPVLANDVKIEIHVSGICGSDIPRVFDNGAHFYPIVLGHEFVGEVVQTGDSVKNVAIGDRVVCAPRLPCLKCENCQKGDITQCKNDSFIGSRLQGGFAEYAVIPEKNAVVFDKSIPYDSAVFFEPVTIGLRGIKIAKDNDKKVILDASGIQFIQAYKEMPTVVKPNEDELKQIMDIDTKDKKNILYATKKMHSDGIKIAAVSLGKEGVVITCDKGSFYVRPPKVNVVNTVGCGDCMVAGFALGIHREYEIDDIIKNACAIATANTLTAATGVYKIADYITFLKQISIEKL